MKWSWKLGRFAGIDLYLHTTFFLLLVWVAVVHWTSARNLEAMLSGVAFTLALFSSVLLHEFGHALAARKFGIGTRNITLLPIGGISRIERVPEKPIQELAVALGGPAVNAFIAAVLFAALTFTDTLVPIGELTLTWGSLVERVMIANISVLFFNLLPAFPMDGGRALRALLASGMPYARATQTAAIVGRGFAVLFGCLGLFVNPLLLLIAVFVWFGASQEASATLMKLSIADAPVSQAMMTNFQTLREDDTLARAADLVIQGSQHDFPVIGTHGVAGLLTRNDLIVALATHGSGYCVADAMKKTFDSVAPTDRLEAVMMRVAESEDSTIPVTDHGELVGLLTTENLAELVMLRNARERSERRKTFR